MNNDMRYIAVFGDTHGHIRLMFQLCRLWQLKHNRWLDGVLQCGDLGFFPDMTQIDKATRRFYKRDPEEMGFARFFSPFGFRETDALLEQTLCGPSDSLETVTAPVYWCHGNHEDFGELERIVGNQNLSSVDYFAKLWHLRTGYTSTLGDIEVAAIGGAPEQADPDDKKRHPYSHWKWINERACNQLLGQHFDLLLSHCAPQGIGGESENFGSIYLGTVVDICQPAYNFFGHHHQPIPAYQIGKTQCFWLNDVNFQRNHHGTFSQINPACMGILRWDNHDTHDFNIVDDPWFHNIHFKNWKHL